MAFNLHKIASDLHGRIDLVFNLDQIASDLHDCLAYACILFGGILVLYVQATFCVWMDIGVHHSWEDVEPTNETLHGNTTLLIPPPCNDSNWSAGSALFTLTALAIVYISYPRGCLIFDRSGRMWRLSPLFAMVETCLIWTRIVTSALKKPRPSFRVVCHALMAVRVCNSWHAYEIAEALEHDADDTEEGRLLPPLWAQPHLYSEPTPAASEADECMEDTIGSPTTCRSRPSRTGSGPTTLEQKAPSLWRTEQAERFAIRGKIIGKALEEVARFEHGPSYRLFIWIPMILQIIKLLVVSRSGALLTRLTGGVYFFSWATIELLMLTSAQQPLKTSSERICAISLCEEWTNDSVYYWPKFKWKDNSALQEGLRTWGRIFGGISATFNTGFTLMLLFGNFTLSDSYITTPHDLFSSAVAVLKLFFIGGVMILLLAIAGFLIAFPAPMVLGQIILLRVWKLFARVTRLDFGPLWFESYPMDVRPMWPAYIAMYNFVILLLFHTGFWWWHPFECWETRKPWFYDWLG